MSPAIFLAHVGVRRRLQATQTNEWSTFAAAELEAWWQMRVFGDLARWE